MKPLIARRGTERGFGFGAQLCFMEREFALLRIRWDIRDDIHEAFLTLGCTLICR
ncbi:hypothetical protein ACIQFZ_41640 [Streptomyces sp. NPDC093064]|uniref:hypothetical protein n=1 Tax=Streptomyces sp. NPDC093064 TaxID=3366020 RepID=UPI0037F28C65